jgi:NitT/TauT family transport system substrate-binding protein
MTAYVKSHRDYNDAFFKDKGKKELIDILCKYSVIKDPAMYEKMFRSVSTRRLSAYERH